MARLNGVKILDMVNGETMKISYEGADYLVIGSEDVRAGDLGLRVKNEYSWVKVGEFYPIVSGRSYADDEGDEPYFNKSDFRFFRRITATTSLSVGDYAKIIDNKTCHGFADNTIVRITEVSGDGVEKAEYLDRSDYYYVSNCDLIRATNEEVTESEAKATVKVGDIVRITAYVNGHSVGTIGEVTSIRYPGGYRNRVCVEADGRTFFERNVETVTSEEAEEYRKQTDETAEWAKIGRKVDEYKVGDVIRAIDTSVTGLAEGHIAIITKVNSSGDVFTDVKNIYGGASFYTKGRVELVTPVELRFDKDVADAA